MFLINRGFPGFFYFGVINGFSVFLVLMDFLWILVDETFFSCFRKYGFLL